MKKQNTGNAQYNQNYILRMQHLTPKLKQEHKGVVFMYSDNKPSIFDEIKYIKTKRPHNYYRPDAKWYIEDLHTRREILLGEDILKNNVITSGMVLGLEGNENELDVLEVKSVFYPGYYSEIDKSKIDTTKTDKPSYKICFLSNICIDQDCNKQKIEAILHYILSCDVKEIVIFGRLFSDESYFRKLENMLQKNIKVTLVPGFEDLTTNLLPQEPFPKRVINFNNVSNPSITQINDKYFILSSGEIVRDMLRYLPSDFRTNEHEATSYDDGIDTVTCDTTFAVMDSILKCQYLAPTTPDTLKSIVFDIEDKFIIDKPVSYFVNGNCDKYGMKVINDCVHICLPSFSKTNEIVIFDMKDDTHETIQFGDA